MTTVGMMERATNVIEREMAKGGASMMQMKNVNSLTKAFGPPCVLGSLFSSNSAPLSVEEREPGHLQSSACAYRDKNMKHTRPSRSWSRARSSMLRTPTSSPLSCRAPPPRRSRQIRGGGLSRRRS